MKTWIKGSLIGLGIWLILISIFLINENMANCSIPSDILGGNCSSQIQDIIYITFIIISFPLTILGISISPNLSTSGPTGVFLFYIGSAIFFALWGGIIGWLIQKLKKKKIKR